MKPAWEPIVVARKPLVGTVAANVEKHGTGALNIDGCRVPNADAAGDRDGEESAERTYEGRGGTDFAMKPGVRGGCPSGRWPANLLHDGSPEVLACFPQTARGKMRPTHTTAGRSVYGNDAEGGFTTMETYGDAGSAARFFYCPKADRADRNDGLVGREKKPLHWSSGNQNPGSFQSPSTNRSSENHHPTVKPTDLMRYLCRLITPPGGTVLDPFTGSGSTGRGATLEGFGFVGIEREAEYVEIAKLRIAKAAGLFSQETA
jgi:site-specific DNA-methyltransferase (adenine-specific)